MVEYGFDHLHFKSSNVEATARFLIDSFGGKELYRRERRGAPTIGVRVGGQDILIIGNFPDEPVLSDSANRRYGLDHFGLVVENIYAACGELEAKGVKIDQPLTELDTLKFTYVSGPDKIRVEIMQRI